MPYYFENRDLPVRFLATWGEEGTIVDVKPRTRCTRLYHVVWDNPEKNKDVNGNPKTYWYKGASTRPRWIKKILKAEPKEKRNEG